MIDMDVLIGRISGLDPRDLERWIVNAWVHPPRSAGRYVFREIDVARVRLIRELRDDMQVNEDALPVVLSLLDQLYDARRRMRDVSDALASIAPDEMRQLLLKRLASHSRDL